tara:strand:+ start:166 stop:279 length:114 start_codon:yes stop_codon:yes gene_type:complete
MTVLFQMKNLSDNDSISSTFSNLKEKLKEYENLEESS